MIQFTQHGNERLDIMVTCHNGKGTIQAGEFKELSLDTFGTPVPFVITYGPTLRRLPKTWDLKTRVFGLVVAVCPAWKNLDLSIPFNNKSLLHLLDYVDMLVSSGSSFVLTVKENGQHVANVEIAENLGSSALLLIHGRQWLKI